MADSDPLSVRSPPSPAMTPTTSTEVWVVDLAIADDRTRACLAVLSAAEQARATRFLRRADRDRYVVSHAAVRHVLGRALDADPRALVFSAGPAGKPELAGPWSGCLEINLSHSGERALIGLSARARIGVDIETIRSLPDALRMARNHFAPDEVAALERCDPSSLLHAFLACWTRKEAFVKAAGVGLSVPLDRFSVTVPPVPAGLVAIAGDAARAHDWSLHHLDPAPGYIGAVAIEAPDALCTVRTLPADWAETLP